MTKTKNRQQKSNINPEAVETMVLLIVNGLSDTNLRQAASENLGIAADQIDDVISEANKRIQLAADYNRDEQLGKARTRYDDIYKRAIKANDTKTALATQKEISKLLRLYPDSTDHATSGGQATGGLEAHRTLSEIAAHLLPLKLAPENQPLEEHARVAALKIANAE